MTDEPVTVKPLVGIDGWLFLPVFIGIPVRLISSLVEVFGGDPWALIDTVPMIILLILAHSKSRFFPGAWITWNWLCVILALLVTVLLVTADNPLYEEIIRKEMITIPANVIWTAYFLKSVRVKNTFVN